MVIQFEFPLPNELIVSRWNRIIKLQIALAIDSKR